jgi:predicted Rossmann fold flavoprotein
MSKNGLKCEVLVIGGGPAGMMAAIGAAEAGTKVVLLEGNSELGIKLMMTGKGRCNLTHAEPDRRKFLEEFGRSGRFLFSAFNAFGMEETVAFFESRGVATRVERGGRVFPVSGQAADVRRVLLEELRKLKVGIVKDARVRRLGGSEGRLTEVQAQGTGTIEFRNVIVATGGLSYPGSGSTGDGLAWARELGHRVITPRPALTPLLVEEEWVGELEGLSLKNVRVDVYQEQKKDERFGEALFTDKGLSGPVILDMSKGIGELLEEGKVRIVIDYKPALSFSELDARIQRDFAAASNRMLKNALDELLPQKLIPVCIALSGIEPERKVNMVTKEERKRLLHLLKEMELHVQRLHGFEKAIITSGGVDLREVDPQTMRSKLIENLYFAGEVLDLDAPTGGYNLQEAWSTGHLAGRSAGEAVVGE